MSKYMYDTYINIFFAYNERTNVTTSACTLTALCILSTK